MRLAEFMVSWLAAAKRRVRPRSYETYEWAWGWVSPLVGGVRLEKFDRTTVLTLIDELEANGASANTINHCLRVMAGVFVDAIAEGVYVGLNPFTLVTKQKPKHTVERGRALSIDECRALLEAAKEDRLEAMWVLALTAGMRIGELCGLQWREIDFAKRTVDVVRQIVYVDGKPTEADLKTTNSQRLLPLGPIAIDALRRRKSTAEGERPSIWVFPTTTNSAAAMAPANARKRNFAETIKRAKLTGKLTPHDLRHTMSTLGDHAGVTANTRAARLGHANSTLTESTYTHPLTGDDVAAAVAIDAVLSGGGG
jgi:integrase